MHSKGRFQHLIFDLDGTISNPREGIFNAYRYAFGKMDLPIPDDDKLKQYVGPPLRKVFGAYLNNNEAAIQAAITAYRHYYIDQQGMYENALFDGMFELLSGLNDYGITLSVATFKGASVDKILDHFAISHFFPIVEFYNEEKGIVTKAQMIANILERLQITDKDQVLMIGDREHDIFAAHETGVKSCAVTYGFGSVEELNKCRPDFTVNDVSALKQLVLSYA